MFQIKQRSVRLFQWVGFDLRLNRNPCCDWKKLPNSLAGDVRDGLDLALHPEVVVIAQTEETILINILLAYRIEGLKRTGFLWQKFT